MRRVFIGLNNIASIVTLLKRGFEANGCRTLTATLHDRNPLKSKDVMFQIGSMIPSESAFENRNTAEVVRRHSFASIKQYVWEKALSECDVFVFIWHSFEPDLSDYKELKEMGKQIVTIFCGDEVRWPQAANDELQSYGLHPMRWNDDYMRYIESADISEKLHRLRVAEKYSDVLLGGPPSLQLALRPYYHFWQPVDLSMFRENAQQRERPVIVHAPTDRAFKGTDYIVPALQRLEEEGVPFDLKLIEGVPFQEVVDIYSDGDILVGQLISPNGGGQEREALASGMVVLSSVGINYPPVHVPEDCPIVPVTPDNIYEELKRVILDRNERARLAKCGRGYVEKYHDAQKVARGILDALDGTGPSPDYTPTFFREQFDPASPQGRHACNLYTEYVRETEWYRAAVQQGERAGLFF